MSSSGRGFLPAELHTAHYGHGIEQVARDCPSQRVLAVGLPSVLVSVPRLHVLVIHCINFRLEIGAHLKSNTSEIWMPRDDNMKVDRGIPFSIFLHGAY